jgi:Putative zinc-finger
MVITCDQVWREISNYVDGDVSPELRAVMEEHFHACARCSSVLAGTRNVIALYGDDRMLEIPAGFSRRMKRRLVGSAAATKKWPTWAAWLVPVAALVLIAGGLKLTNTFTFRRPVKSILAEPGKNIPPSLQVVVSDGSRLFHVPGCSFIHDKSSERTLTAKEAMQQGYMPCPRCLKQYLRTGLIHHSDHDDGLACAQTQTANLGF